MFGACPSDESASFPRSAIFVSDYPVMNTLPFLRTHVLCWIRKAGTR